VPAQQIGDLKAVLKCLNFLALHYGGQNSGHR